MTKTDNVWLYMVFRSFESSYAYYHIHTCLTNKGCIEEMAIRKATITKNTIRETLTKQIMTKYNARFIITDTQTKTNCKTAKEEQLGMVSGNYYCEMAELTVPNCSSFAVRVCLYIPSTSRKHAYIVLTPLNPTFI